MDDLEKGLHKAYALIFTNYCTKAMQNRIEQHPDYQSTIMDDPIALLETIKTLVSPEKNHKVYRELLKSTTPPCIPYLGIYLADLTFIEEITDNLIN